jgi:hypothetical protein
MEGTCKIRREKNKKLKSPSSASKGGIKLDVIN